MGDRTSNREGKVRLEPGFSQVHWMMLTQKSKDMTGGHGVRRNISREEIAQHNTEHDCWTILDGKVYNLTPYLRYHPGGVGKLMLSAGGDCTTLFNESHAWVNGHGMLEKCFLGTVESTPSTVASSAKDSTVVLSSVEYRSLRLLSVRDVSAMTKLFQFELPRGKTLGLTLPGQHVKVRVAIRGTFYERAYTPISAIHQKHTVDILIKIYPDGIVTSHLAALPVGSLVDMLGPQGSFGYSGVGTISLSPSVAARPVTDIAMVAAGSGITPMLTLINAVMRGSVFDTTKLTLIYCNRSPAHVIAKSTLAPLHNMFPGRFRWLNVLSVDRTSSVDGGEKKEADDEDVKPFVVGSRLTRAMLEANLPPPSDQVCVVFCGPPSFDEFVGVELRALGYPWVHQF
ncbi:hypothetical protein H257_09271 [Aphanomyces astaci]|uniref:Cytochrome-b5 reductase n=1 Tax=Aphanomyces astaci TaxID=112090 RepID=W4GCM4_APHAT|nr:hypothetical protein H257_09271 [Aphanomyces astaci]ETV76824.1 hypothetical protein H257_09271 [Aphanomyces astaci]|eukprot:XP_009833736.1 hypothetical protein H257_09271 [Aphanomyces astaci]